MECLARHESRSHEQPPTKKGSELLASHPGLNVTLGLRFRDARALLDHSAELNLVLDRRQVEVGHKGPSLLRVLHVAPLARDRAGALAALKSEHSDSPWGASGRRPGEQS